MLCEHGLRSTRMVVEHLEQKLVLSSLLEVPDEPFIKWDQPPEVTQPDNVLYGWNEPSVFGGQAIAADDWFCDTADPVTSIVWWGSFLDWTDVTAPPLPDEFHFAIWTDVPAGVDQPWSHPGRRDLGVLDRRMCSMNGRVGTLTRGRSRSRRRIVLKST